MRLIDNGIGEKILTTEQLAGELNCSKGTVLNWVSTKRGFPVIKIGRKNGYYKSEVLSYFNRRQHGSKKNR